MADLGERKWLTEHLERGHLRLLKETSADTATRLHAAEVHAGPVDVQKLAQTMFFLWTGEGESLFLKRIDELKVAARNDAEAYVPTVNNGIYLENLVQLLSWRSFRLDTAAGKKAPMRRRLNLDSIRKMIEPLAGQYAPLDPWIAIAMIEVRQVPSKELVSALDERCVGDAQFRLLRALVTRPYDGVKVAELIASEPQFVPLAWMTKTDTPEITISLLDKQVLAPEDFDLLAESARKALNQLKENAAARVAEKTVRAIRRHILEVIQQPC